MTENLLRLEYVPLSQAIIWDENLKEHDIGALVTAIWRYGFQDPAKYDGALKALVYGNGRMMALTMGKREGRPPPAGIALIEEADDWAVPVVFGNDLPSREVATAFALDHNSLTMAGGEFAPWDIAKMYKESGYLDALQALAAEGELPISVDGEDLAALLSQFAPQEPPEDKGPQIDRAAELQEKWGTATGQIWQLGDHRLAVGDCTDRTVVEAVMRGEKADAVVTDPPYGVGKEYESFEDSEENVRELIDNLMPIINDMKPIALTPGIPMMWFYPRPSWLMVWVHPAPSGSCPWGFAGVNPILVYGKDPYLQAGLGRRADSITLAADREAVEGHLPKPITAWSWLVERLTIKMGQVVFDPLVGSGTTIVACQRLGRRCRAIEIEPKYCAVTIQRYVDMTGHEPQLMG